MAPLEDSPINIRVLLPILARKCSITCKRNKNCGSIALTQSHHIEKLLKKFNY